jgi:hypothetical protein
VVLIGVWRISSWSGAACLRHSTWSVPSLVRATPTSSMLRPSVSVTRSTRARGVGCARAVRRDVVVVESTAPAGPDQRDETGDDRGENEQATHTGTCLLGYGDTCHSRPDARARGASESRSILYPREAVDLPEIGNSFQYPAATARVAARRARSRRRAQELADTPTRTRRARSTRR